MLNKIKFTLFAVGLLLTFCTPKNVQAETTSFSLSDLDSKGQITQEFIEDDTYHTISIQKDINPKNMQLHSFSGKLNNTYTVQHNKIGYYTAKYKIDITNSKITRAHSAQVVPKIGSISTKRLSRVSSSQANLFFSQKVALSQINRNIRSSIESGNILINVN
ncbi:hypothetical protein APT62_09245 [Aerococcus urinaeequi]|uniref:DUF5626 domain-containing protein n=3 Tax=Aerococcus urinaeequi TaxID=51665 RepID=A0AAC8X0S9_9LACT|nr:DUF5626 family protein [Aerococcus urinaeequi]ALZ88620.1 hypothetical protein APT62_09245 [Aerococcus urinaeequi]AMB97605.1 hypothetical protein AWM74_04890 [Aerococcus urinaeequi]